MSSGRRRTTERHYSAEDQALDQISKEAEEKIQARRQARVEAREIRLREIERQQKEDEDKQKGLQQGSEKSLSGYSGSRRGSDDSTGSDMSSSSRDPKDQVRLVKNQLRDLEEKYKAAMVTNAQLDNVKTSHVFQLELLKEQIEEQEEAMIEVQREYKDKCRDFELLKRDFEALKLESDGLKQQIDLKDKLIKESGLVIATTDDGNFCLSRCSDLFDVPVTEMGSAIISEEAADLLKKAGEGTLGKTDFNRKNDNCYVKQNQDSQLTDPETKNDETNGNKFSSSDDDVEHSELSMVSDTTVETQADNNEIIDVVDKSYANENDVSTCIDSVAIDDVDNKHASGVVPVAEVSERQRMIDASDEESDENDVFFESKSEISPDGVQCESSSKAENELHPPDSGVDVVDEHVENESNEVPENLVEEKDTILAQKSDTEIGEVYDRENDCVDKTENISEKETSDVECVVREKECEGEVGEERICSVDNVDEVIDLPQEPETECSPIGPVNESGTGKNISANDAGVIFCIEDSDAVFSELVSETLEKNRNDINNVNPDSKKTAKLGDDLDCQQDFPSVSCISCESDVTYNSESEDELFQEAELNAGKSNQSESLTNPEHSNKDNDKNGNELNDELVSIGGSADVNVSGIGLEHSGSAIPLCSSISSESDLEDSFGMNRSNGKDIGKHFDEVSIDKGMVICDVSGFVSECDRDISLGQSDEVFISSPLDELRADISLNVFARDYVKGVIQKTVDLYNKDTEQDKITVKKKSVSAEDISISVSKRHYSEDLIDSASSVFTQKMSSGSVEILSPFLGVPSEGTDNQSFFSCKVETDLDVKNASERGNTLSAESMRSTISGFAVCYTGLEGISDVDSDSDGEDTIPSADSKPLELCPDFTIMPMNIPMQPGTSVSLSNDIEDREESKNEEVAMHTNAEDKFTEETTDSNKVDKVSISDKMDTDTFIENETGQLNSTKNDSLDILEIKDDSDGESINREGTEVDCENEDENCQNKSSDVKIPETNNVMPVDAEEKVENIEENLPKSQSLDDKADKCINCEEQPSEAATPSTKDDTDKAIKDQVDGSEEKLDELKSEKTGTDVGDKEGDEKDANNKESDTFIENETGQLNSTNNDSLDILEIKDDSGGESINREGTEVDSENEDENCQNKSSDVKIPETNNVMPVDAEEKVENIEENLPKSQSLDDKADKCINCEEQPSEAAKPSTKEDTDKAIKDQVDGSEEKLDELKSEKTGTAVGDKEGDEKDANNKESDNEKTEDITEEKEGIVIQGAHGGQSDDDDEEDGSGISLSDDDILADLKKCDDDSGVKDSTDVTKVQYKTMDKNEKEHLVKDAKENEDVWVKQEKSISDKGGEEQQAKASLSANNSGDRRSGEVTPTDEDGQDLESVLSRKQSKKKSKKKNAKEKEEYDKLKKIVNDKKQLQEEINTLTNQVSEERSKRTEGGSQKSNNMNGPELQLYEIQREASKQIHEYKLKLQKAEQEITNLDGTVNRLETQVKRFKYDAEEAERLEEELKSDRRRLQRELRECQNQIEELQNQNKHLTKRLEKIRQTRSALGVST